MGGRRAAERSQEDEASIASTSAAAKSRVTLQPPVPMHGRWVIHKRLRELVLPLRANYASESLFQAL